MQLHSTSDEFDKYYTTLVDIVHSFQSDHCKTEATMHSSTTKILCMHEYNCIAIYIRN